MQQLNEDIERRIKRSAAAQRVFSGPDGELIFNELKLFCRAETLLFDDNNPDPYILASRVGKRDVFQFINNMLKEDVEKAMKLLRERKENENATRG